MICPKKPKPKRKVYRVYDKSERAVKFRSSKEWTLKALEIKERDGWCCVACYMCDKYPELIDLGEKKMNYENLEAHHIKKLGEDIELKYALDNNFLITLCRKHHKLADLGKIPESLLEKLARENTENGLNIVFGGENDGGDIY